ncbi:M1 family metallopeptidase [soil metagenome]
MGIARILAGSTFLLLASTVSLPALAQSAASSAASLPSGSDARQVLPDAIVPTHYDLSIAPDADKLTFSGTVEITIEVNATGNEVTLNAVGLAFDSAMLDAGQVGTATYDAPLGRATLHFANAIAVGTHRLKIAYHGKIDRTTLGFFAMDYDTPDGKRRTLATNLEPAAARQVLPCWDEPARKATFTVAVTIPKDQSAYSNMPVEKTLSLSPTMQQVRFQTSPKMSTYLLFLGVGDFERVHQTVDGVDFGIVVKRGDTAKAAYALDQAGKILLYYNDYFGVRYPLPKLDLIAAPGQIAGGSMENWGAIFYSQNHLLFDPARGTETDRQLVFEVVSHEMAHQWFGDLVTMAWWDNLWLNEGFARWMQTYSADALHPEWETGLKAQDVFESGKQADSLPSTHPVLQPVLTADQASQAFDSITYDKGAAVITMLNAYIGADSFREGVRGYMKAHAFGNTVDTDLWSIMQQVAGKPILKIEQDFTRQEGLPLIKLADAADGVRLTEGRFFIDGSVAASPQSWSLPLPVAKPGEAPRTILLEGATTIAAKPPILINAGQTGYARILYPQAAFDALLPSVPTLQPVDQLGLINDAAALGVAGYAPASNALAVAARIPADADPLVWSRVVDFLQEVDRRYGDRPGRAAFRSYARRLLAPVTTRLGSVAVAGESPNTPSLRGSLQRALGQFGDAGVVAEARRMVADDSGTPTQQRTARARTAAKADPATFDMLLARARKIQDPLEKQRLYGALGGVEDPALAKRMIAIGLSDEVPAGSNAGVLVPAARNYPDMAWAEIIPNMSRPGLFDTNTQWLIAAGIGAMSSDPARIAELQAYEKANVPPEAQKPFQGAIASIKLNQRVATEMLPEIDRWIDTH